VGQNNLVLKMVLVFHLYTLDDKLRFSRADLYATTPRDNLLLN
jgi:hypothetical protein